MGKEDGTQFLYICKQRLINLIYLFDLDTQFFMNMKKLILS